MSHSIVNVSGTIGLLLLIGVLLRSERGVTRGQTRARTWVVIPALILAVFGSFAPGLQLPLLHDSCFLVYLPSTQSFPEVLRLFDKRLASGDYFYRPLTFLVFWVYSKWAMFDATRWHVLSVAGHALNTCLLYALGRRLRLPGCGAVLAALLFAVHGARPEAVTWVAARVDVLATFFALMTLIGAWEAVEKGRFWRFGVVAILGTAALLSKESAFCLPVLVPAMLLVTKWNGRATAVCSLLATITGAMFCWRQQVLGSIGGYGAATGHPTALQFSLLKTLEVLGFRLWGLLSVPLNWSIQPDWWVWIASALALAGFGVLLVQGSSVRSRVLWALLAMTLGAALPVQHLLLIGPDLSGSRLIYLPSVGFVLFLGAAIGGMHKVHLQWLVELGVVAFQFAAMQHNLYIWRQVAVISRQADNDFLHLAQLDKPMTVLGLPAKRDGVPFLQNCFQYCLVVNSGVARPPVLDSGSAPFIRWDDQQNRFELVVN